jgi:hypothetical protein
MLKYFLSIFILIALSMSSMTQENSDFPAIGKTEIKGAVITQVRSFTGESLYGYIDGGADLYLEYGFSGLHVTEFTKEKSVIKVEVWKMNDQESAFGIFSVSRFRCRSHPAFTDLACQNKYQLQFCKGNYYVNIINESATPADSVISTEAATLLAGKIPGKPLNLRKYLPDIDSGLLINESKLVRGRLGVNNGVPDIEAYFRDSGDFIALILPEPEKFVLSVKFSDMNALRKFADQHNWGSIPENGKSAVMRSGESVTRKDEKQVVIEIPVGSGNGGIE